jgi:hypothetical protein
MLIHSKRSRRRLELRLYVILVSYLLSLAGRTDWFFQMPTFMVFKDGNKIDELVGAHAGQLEVCLTWMSGKHRMVADKLCSNCS